MILIEEEKNMEYDIESLLQSISEKRTEMLDIANKYGLQSDKTIECSQDLDKLILVYQELRMNELL